MGVVGDPTALLLCELNADTAEVEVLRSVGERRESEDVLVTAEADVDEDITAIGGSTTIVPFDVSLPSEDEALGCGDVDGRGDEAMSLCTVVEAK